MKSVFIITDEYDSSIYKIFTTKKNAIDELKRLGYKKAKTFCDWYVSIDDIETETENDLINNNNYFSISKYELITNKRR